MFFDDQTLTAAYHFASQFYEEHRELSNQELKLIMIAALGDVPLASARLEAVRRSVSYSRGGSNRILFVIAALCELDRISGDKGLPPVRVVDIMSHIQTFREQIPLDTPIECHGNSTLPLALWFASKKALVYFTGDILLAECCSAIAGSKIHWVSPEEPFIKKAYHFTCLLKSNASVSSFYQKLFRSHYSSAVILTTWSFLTGNTPRTLHLKQKFISSGELRTVIQLPAGIMSRTLPALIQLAPPKAETERKVRLINAKDWFILSREGTIEVSYLSPVLEQVDRKVHVDGTVRSPAPPAEDVLPTDLLLRQCDLRMKTAEIPHNVDKHDLLGDCATLIRGQLLPVRSLHEIAHEYREVVLTDIGEFGLITSASRVLDNAPRLTPSRELALLRRNDILLCCKGSLQALGQVGIVTQCLPNWLPNQSFYLIRARDIDPVWLFYFLQSKAAQEYFRSHSSGTTVPQIKVGDLSSLHIPLPDEIQLKEIHKIHENTMKTVKKIQLLREVQNENLKQCQLVFDSMM